MESKRSAKRAASITAVPGSPTKRRAAKAKITKCLFTEMLPPEIREIIFEYCLSFRKGLHYGQRRAWFNEPSLGDFAVNKQIYNEAAAVFYKVNKFIVRHDSLSKPAEGGGPTNWLSARIDIPIYSIRNLEIRTCRGKPPIFHDRFMGSAGRPPIATVVKYISHMPYIKRVIITCDDGNSFIEFAEELKKPIRLASQSRAETLELYGIKVGRLGVTGVCPCFEIRYEDLTDSWNEASVLERSPGPHYLSRSDRTLSRLMLYKGFCNDEHRVFRNLEPFFQKQEGNQIMGIDRYKLVLRGPDGQSEKLLADFSRQLAEIFIDVVGRDQRDRTVLGFATDDSPNHTPRGFQDPQCWLFSEGIEAAKDVQNARKDQRKGSTTEDGGLSIMMKRLGR